MARYRLWIGGMIIAVLLGMQLLEALHRHHDGVTERNCPICLAAAHQIGDTPTPVPEPSAAVSWFLLYFTQPSPVRLSIADALPSLPYRSRAPPRTAIAI